mgnify:FL=1|tara:strand:- start:513 stop:743 length:231 start_codon:yes stop_codon:yes gene_type:complete
MDIMSKQTYKNSEVVNWIKYPLRMDENSAQWVKNQSDKNNISINKVINSVIDHARQHDMDSVFNPGTEKVKDNKEN